MKEEGGAPAADAESKPHLISSPFSFVTTAASATAAVSAACAAARPAARLLRQEGE